MPIVVQKYGGTSVADLSRIRKCAGRAIAAASNGHQVVVVVSAMGHTTDELIELAEELSERPAPRELDLLMSTGETVSCSLMAMAIQAMGVDAIALAGAQLGIDTDACHSKAKIQAIDAGRIHRELQRGRIVVAAGFQGISPEGAITTLGRGGSDTTAVALACALSSDGERAICEIYTDVDGVYTADPRRVPNARKLAQISYDEMLELASLGAGVMHSRAVMFGRNYAVPIHVRHSQKPDPGTMIIQETPEMEQISVVGAVLTPDLGRVSLRKIPNRTGVQAQIFRHVAAADILVDDIMQIEYGDRVDLSFTVEFKDLADIKTAVSKAQDELGGEMAVEVGLAKVSVVGVGMRTHTGVASTLFEALGKAGINIANITTSEIKISCIVAKEHGEQALRIVHDAFGLDHEPQVAGRLKTEAGQFAVKSY